MVRPRKKEFCCLPVGEAGSIKVESVVSVDERGQMVLPKELREKAGIRAGDKLAIISWEKGSQICCICLIKAEDFAGMAKSLLGPMLKEILPASR